MGRRDRKIRESNTSSIFADIVITQRMVNKNSWSVKPVSTTRSSPIPEDTERERGRKPQKLHKKNVTCKLEMFLQLYPITAAFFFFQYFD